MSWLLLPIVAIFAFYYASTIRRTGPVTADSLFVYLQLMMALGSFPLLDPNLPADRTYGYILAYTLIAYMLVSAYLHASWGTAKTRPDEQTIATFRPGFHTWLVLILSAAVTVLYFRTIGYVALFDGIANARSGGDRDIAGLRLDSYDGSKYLFPGYVNQLKNALLPALSALTILAWFRSGRRLWPMTTGLASVSAIGLLGTGQRGAFVIFIATLVTFIYMLNRAAFPRRAVIIVALAVPFILTSTIALGRSSDRLTANSSQLQRVTVALVEFQGRVLNSNQVAAVEGFRYIHDQTEVQDGREWLLSAKGMLPGNSGSDLANRIFERLYGTPRGTAPESIWGSIYLNFGRNGIILSPFVLAMIIGRVTRSSRREIPRNTLEIMGIAGVTTTLGFWVVSTPVALANLGIGVYGLLWFVGSRMRNSADSRQPATDSEAVGA